MPEGVERLADLAIGTGKPPSNEPQISLGALQIMNEKTIKEGLSSTEVLQLLTQFSIAIQASIYSTSIVVIPSKPVNNGHVFGDFNNPGISLFFDHVNLLECLKFNHALCEGNVKLSCNLIPASYNSL